MKTSLSVPIKIRRLAKAHMPTIVYLAAMIAVLYKLPVPLYLKTAAAVPMTAYSILIFPNTRSFLSRRGHILLLIVGLMGIAAALCYGINRRWIDHQGFNGAVWSIFARAIDRYGFAATHGYCYWTGGSPFVPSATIYNHHPPALTWMIALAFRAFKESELVARAVPILFTLSGITSLLVLLTKRLGAAPASAMFPLLLASPGFLYFGRMVNFEPVVLGIALTFYSWLILGPKSTWASGALLSLVIVAPLFGWVGTPFALGASYVYAKRTFPSRRGLSLLVILLPLTVFVACVLYISDWGSSLPATFQRSLSWNNLVRPDTTSYTVWEWFQRIRQNGNAMMPWPLWGLLLILPFVSLRKTSALTLLYGCTLPFLVMIPLMPHAVYVHDYHLMFVWLPGGVGLVHVMSRFKHKTSLVLMSSLLLLIPLRQGLLKVARMHDPNTYAIHQARTGLSLNAATDPEDKVAVINTANDPAPILAYYLDRHYGVFPHLTPALHDSSWDYYIFLHNFRGLSETEQSAARQMIKVPETYVLTFTRESPVTQPVEEEK